MESLFQEELRTLFVSGLPQDVKEREFYLLFQGFSGKFYLKIWLKKESLAGRSLFQVLRLQYCAADQAHQFSLVVPRTAQYSLTERISFKHLTCNIFRFRVCNRQAACAKRQAAQQPAARAGRVFDLRQS